MDSIFINKQEDHKFKLDQYEGPLDLLLSMIKEAKIDIKDIFLSKITDQYIEYIRSMEILDMEKASDFVAMAATLLEIKSNDLLIPDLDIPDDDNYYEDEKHELQRQLEMYSLIQELSEKLKENETKYRFFRSPQFDDDDCRLVFNGLNSIDNLIAAFGNLMMRFDIKEHSLEPKNIEKDIYTVAQKVIFLVTLMKQERRVSFFNLFVNDRSRSAVLNTFLALLELLKRQFIQVIQEDRFGDIIIEIKEGMDEFSLEDFQDEESQANN
jgi:segregation and condensation protein A